MRTPASQQKKFIIKLNRNVKVSSNVEVMSQKIQLFCDNQVVDFFIKRYKRKRKRRGEERKREM